MKKFLIFLIFFIFHPLFLFSGVKFYGSVYEDVSENFVSGVNVFLIGPNLSTTSTNPYFYNDRMINFERNSVPKFSSFMVKCSKSGYVNTIWGPMGVGDQDTSESNPIFSMSFYLNILHGGTAPSHQSGKADIGGMVSNENGGVSGVVITAKYLDTNTNAGTIKYFGDNMLPGNYSSTQSNGVFCIYNVEVGRPILITGSKSGTKFTQYITIGYSDSVNIAGLEQVDNYISISGNVKDENDNNISGVNISIVGTSISTSSGTNGYFTLNNVPPNSFIIGKMSKSGYKDTYMIGKTKDGNVSDAELIIISNTFYNQVLNQIGKTHTSGKGDIAGSIGEIEGAVVKLYDYNGNPVNLSDKLFYANENGQFIPSLTSTSTNGVFIIINLDPGVYFIKGEKQGIEFPVNMTCVFANGLTIYETGMKFPTLYVWAGEEIQNLPPEIQKNATNVEMLRFNLWREGESENILVQSITFTAKGTGNISNSVGSAKLYYRPNWTDWQLVGTGNISGNKIIFNNLNLEVWESGNSAKYLSLVFDFNGNASPEQTFGVDIFSGDISAVGISSQIPAKIEGLPVYGKTTTIAQVYPPLKPWNYYPQNGDVNIDGTNYKLWATPFNPGNGNPIFVASQWQIRKYDQTYQNPYWDSGENYIPTYIIDTPINLDENMTYFWRVRYKNGDNVWSEWSDETWFTTGKTVQYYPPGKPQNIKPENGQTNIDPKNCKLESSQFSSNYPSDIHIASQWQIREQNSEIPVFDSGFDTGNKTSIIVPSNILSYNKTYYWRVRYFGQQSGWSDWSEETYFKTLERQKGDINGDGQIDIIDVIKCLRMVIGLDEKDPIGDMNDDGEIDITDVIKVLRKAIKLE